MYNLEKWKKQPISTITLETLFEIIEDDCLFVLDIETGLNDLIKKESK